MKRLIVAIITLSVLLAVPVVAAAADDNHCGAKGTYAFTGFGTTYEGNLFFPVGNISLNGTITLDGNGNSFIRETEVVNGVVVNFSKEYTGTYALNPDCTFTASLTGVPVPIFVGVVADHGKQIRAMITAPGVQVNFTNTIRVHP